MKHVFLHGMNEGSTGVTLGFKDGNKVLKVLMS
jgi:hypothetical protein